VTRKNEAIEILNGKYNKLKRQTVDSILNNQNFYNPSVIDTLPRELFSQDKLDDATYWFCVAKLRARFVAYCCIDNSAKQAVSVLTDNMDQTLINMHFKKLINLKNSYQSV
jgi:hypothetical protein